MPLFYSGSGRWSGDRQSKASSDSIGGASLIPTSTSSFKQKSHSDTIYENPDQSIRQTQTSSSEPEAQLSTAVGQATVEYRRPVNGVEEAGRRVSVKRRKFSFRNGKVSVQEVAPTDAKEDEEQNIVLEVDGREISVKEKSLVESSLHFSRIFEDISLHPDSDYLQLPEDEQEDEDLEVDPEAVHDNPLAGLPYETVAAMMSFISTSNESELQISDVTVSTLQQTARLLSIPVVEKLCKKFVEKGLNTENCLKRFTLADSFLGWTDTAKHIQTFLEEKIEDVLRDNKEDLLEINEHQLKRLLSSPNLQLASEDRGLDLALDWTRHNIEQRRPLFPPIFECVELHCIKHPERLQQLLKDDLVGQDKMCVELVEQAIAYHNQSDEEKIKTWEQEQRPGRWPKILVVLSYAEKILEYYDFQTQEWSVLTEKPDWVFGAELVSLDRYLYTIGGVSSRQVDRYDPETDAWTDGSWPGLKKPRLAHGVCVAPEGRNGGALYAAGGTPEVGGKGHCDIETIVPGAPAECDCKLCGPFDHLKWELLPNKMANPRTFTAMTFLSNKIYMVGGDQAADNTNSSLEIFDLRTSSWRSSSSTAAKRDSCRITVLNDDIIAVGGHDNNTNNFLSSCEKYSVKNEKWCQFPKMKFARRSPGLVTYRGQLFCVGGMGSKKDLATMERFSTVDRKWTLMPGQMKNLSGWISATLIHKPIRLMKTTDES